MEITLIRHGRSSFTEAKKITCHHFKKWVEMYDFHGVDEEIVYPPNTLKKAATAKILLTSDLKRSVESAKLLNPEMEVVSDPLFREMELPTFKLFNVKLRPQVWAIFLRLLWFLGYSKECESLRNAKTRAEEASQKLILYANGNKAVVLVGHGFFNKFLAKQLRQKGWKGKRQISAKHWECSTYSFFE